MEGQASAKRLWAVSNVHTYMLGYRGYVSNNGCGATVQDNKVGTHLKSGFWSYQGRHLKPSNWSSSIYMK